MSDEQDKKDAFEKIRKLKESLRMSGDCLGLGTDPELRVSLLDSTLLQYIDGDTSALKAWSDMVASELESEDWMAQHHEGSKPGLEAHRYLYELLHNRID